MLFPFRQQHSNVMELIQLLELCAWLLLESQESAIAEGPELQPEFVVTCHAFQATVQSADCGAIGGSHATPTDSCGGLLSVQAPSDILWFRFGWMSTCWNWRADPA